MTPDRWRRVEELFNQAVDMPAAERQAWLDRECADDLEVHNEVRSLLATDSESARGGLEQPVHEAILSLDRRGGRRRVGRYQLLKQIGKGGMGAVYLAVRDGEFQRRVAIKLVRQDMDSEEVLNRFRRERQLLAFLTHPNIALLLDGGATDEGQPYFVMEYVDGVPITRYCQDRDLAIEDRLKLFVQVCAAVQHAHANLIVHRDLKPGNILVTRDGVPKLLDFGIAKLLLPDLGSSNPQTSTDMRRFTPHYASPEQVRGETVTTSTDIYSLGAILFELMTGYRAHEIDSLSPAEIQHLICDVDVQKPSVVAAKHGAPSRVVRQIAGDLDNIVLMATKREPERRYKSVEQLAEDIKHFLEGRPVRARTDTFGYRTNKFVQRHRLSLTAGAAMAVSLAAGAGVALHQARLAERRFDQVRNLANTFLFDFHDQIQNLPGSTPAREMVVNTALTYLDSLAAESGGEFSLQLELATAYERVGDVQGHVLTSNLGNTTGALESYRKALALADPLSITGNLEAGQRVMSVLQKISDVLTYRGDAQGAMKALEKARDLGEPLAARNPTDQSVRGSLAAIYTELGISQSRRGNLAGGLENARRAVTIWEDVVARQSSDLDAKGRLATAYANLGGTLLRANELQTAIESYRKGLAITKALHDLQPQSTARRRALMLAYSHVADTLGSPTSPSLGDFEGALTHYQPMLSLAEAVAAADAQDKRARSDLAISLMRVGSTLGATGKHQESADLLRRSAAIMEELRPQDPNDLRLQSNLVFLYGRLGDQLLATGDSVGAMQEYRKAVALGERLVTPTADLDNFRVLLTLYARMTPEMAALGDRSGSTALADKALKMAEGWVAKDPSNSRVQASLALSYGGLGSTYVRLAQSGRGTRSEDDWKQARAWHEKSAAAWAAIPTGAAISPMEATLKERTVRELALAVKN